MIEANYYAPRKLDEALQLLTGGIDGLVVLAGGTDLMPKINYYENHPKAVMYLGGVGLEYIRDDGGELVIGACTPIARILQSDLVVKAAPILVEAASKHSSPAIRSVGTIGGNIINASPAADMVVPLIAMDASLVLASAAGERTLKIGEFFKGPGETACAANELLKEIHVPKAKGGTAFVKLGKRKAQMLSVVSAGVRLYTEGGVCKEARIALGSVAPTAIRCPEAEAMLTGAQITPDLLRKAAQAAMDASNPIDDTRATAWYRKEAGVGIARQALFAAAGLEYTD